MTGRTSEGVVISVDAATEALSPKMAKAVAELEKLKLSADDIAERFDKATAKAAAKFGPFADRIEAAQESLRGSFSGTQKAIERLGDTLAKTGAVGAAEARAAADQAKARAAAIAQVEAAFQREAAAQGTVTVQTKISLAAAQAARVEAEAYARQLLVEAGALERVEIGLREQAAAQNSLIPAQRRTVVSAGQQRAALQQLGFQMGDVATQFAAGTPAMLIFAQQSGQIVQAFSLMEAGGSSFIKFLGGPWGIALSVAATALAGLALRHGDSTNAAKKSEAAHETLADKLNLAKHSYDEVIASLRDYNEEQRKSRELTLEAAAASAVAAKKAIDDAIARRKVLQLALESAKAEAERANANAGTGGRAANLGGYGQAYAAKANLESIQQQLDKNKEALNGLETLARGTVVSVAEELAKINTDPRYAIEDRFDRARRSAEKTITNARLLRIELERINRLDKTELEKLDKSKRSSPNSQETATFILPVAGERTGKFGEQRPGHSHAGIDLAVPVGTPVKAPAGGVVIEAGNVPGYGNVVFIDHGAGTISRLAHLSSIGVKKGEQLGQGDVVGASGGAKGAPGAGNSQGPHVHFEVRRNGKPVRPTGSFPVDSLGAANRGFRAEADARAAQLRDEISFGDDLRQARHRLLEATRKTAETEAKRDALLVEDIEAEATTQKKKILDRKEAGDLTGKQAEELLLVNEQLKQQRLDNVKIARAQATIAEQYDDLLDQLDAERAILRIKETTARTEAERRDIARRLLKLDQEAERVALKKIAESSNDEGDIARADGALRRLPAKHRAEDDAFENDRRDPIGEYRKRLEEAVGDTNNALDQVRADGLQSLEDGLVGVITGTESVGSAFKKMANQIIADLVRIAVQKLILNSILGGFGFASGGPVNLLGGTPFAGKKATGGSIRGPGTGTSDSILALLSNGEFVINAAATREHLPLLEAINANRLPKFAAGGLAAPRIPAIRSRPAGFGDRGARGDIAVTINAPGATAETVSMIRREIANAAPALIQASAATTARQMNRRRL